MKKGNNTISSIFKGSQVIDKIMKGTLVVYEAWKKLFASGVPPITLQKCKGKLPNGYQEVEYIESTGTQWIDTGFIPTRTMRVEDTVSDITPIDGGATLFGASGTSVNRIQVYHTHDPRFGARMFTQGAIANLIPNNLTDKRTVIFDCKNNIFSIDDNQSTTLVDGDGKLFDYSLTIFGNNMTGAIATLSTHRQYEFKIYDNDILVRNMIPCYRKSDNEIGMYDLVNGVFYENEGTGTFLKGENVSTGVDLLDYKIYGNSKQGDLPSEYQQVEYIQTTETQYIDSGVPLKCGLKTIVDWVYEDAASYNSYTGAHIGSPGNRWLIGSQRQNKVYFFGVGAGNTSTGIKFGNRDIVEAYWADKASYIKINGVQSISTYDHFALVEEPNYTFYIGAVDRDGNATLMPKLTIYSWKFYQDDILIRDFIPCYRKSDNEIGLYDLVENKFYTNNGTDTFLKGNDILPTPEEPIEIKSVGDKTNNLLNERLLGQVEGYNTYENGMWTTSDLGSYGRDIFYNAAGTNHNVDINKVPKVTPNTTITVKFYDYINNDIDMTYTLYIGLYDSEGTYISKNTINPSNVFTIEIPENVHYISFFRSSNYGTISFSHIQVVEGSYTETTIPDYEPYGYKIPVISRGKNVLDYKKFIKEGKTFEIENGIQYEPLSGTQNVTFDFTFKANTTYVLSGIVTGNLYFGGQLQTTGENTPLSAYAWLTSSGSSLKIRNTSNEDLTRTLYCRLLNGNPDVVSSIKNLQLEVAETKTDYEPYVEPITTNIYLNEPLRKIDDYADYIDFEKGKVVRNIIEKRIEKINSLQSINSNGIANFQFVSSNYKIGAYSICLCNRFKSSTHAIANETEQTIYIYTGESRASYLRINSETASTVDEMNEWLSNNETIYAYPLQEQDDTETIQLPNIPTFKGTTIIDVDTEVSPDTIEITYKGRE